VFAEEAVAACDLDSAAVAREPLRVVARFDSHDWPGELDRRAPVVGLVVRVEGSAAAGVRFQMAAHCDNPD
jgi:hypothetical protein